MVEIGFLWDHVVFCRSRVLSGNDSVLFLSRTVLYAVKRSMTGLMGPFHLGQKATTDRPDDWRSERSESKSNPKYQNFESRPGTMTVDPVQICYPIPYTHLLGYSSVFDDSLSTNYSSYDVSNVKVETKKKSPLQLRDANPQHFWPCLSNLTIQPWTMSVSSFAFLITVLLISTSLSQSTTTLTPVKTTIINRAGEPFNLYWVDVLNGRREVAMLPGPFEDSQNMTVSSFFVFIQIC